MRGSLRATHRPVLRLVSLLLSVALLLGCSRGHPGPSNLPPPTPSTSVGPGDVFEVSVLGEKDLPKEYRVQPDGSIGFPYIDRIEVAGLEPQQIEELIKKQLVERKILVDPQITLVVKQYNSKKVSVIGSVQKPGSLPWTEGMKLVEAISLAGGFTQLADANHVFLTRTVGPSKTVTAVVSVDDISEGKAADIPLQAGDTIKVETRVF
jgi:protein involved in polysaccharide export with SLBB domain